MFPALVFGDVPSVAELHADLVAAGVPVEDGLQRRVDFHSLRHTLATNFARSGIAPRVAMEVMRHSDMRLTMKVYTDVQLLPTSDAVERLPRYDVAVAVESGTGTGSVVRSDTHQDTHGVVISCQSVSSRVTGGEVLQAAESAGNSGKSPLLSTSVTARQSGGDDWGTRIRT